MGRLRTAVQTLSDLELPPDEILGHLNNLVSGLGDDSFATCQGAADLDPAGGPVRGGRPGSRTGGPWGQPAGDDRLHGLDIVRELATESGIAGDALTGWVAWARFDGRAGLPRRGAT